jgi:Tol biopolymer transport system component
VLICCFAPTAEIPLDYNRCQKYDLPKVSDPSKREYGVIERWYTAFFARAKGNPGKPRVKIEFANPEHLLGEMIYLHRNKNEAYSIYRTCAKGTGDRLVYTHKDSVNPNIIDVRWAKNGTAIEFIARNDGQWSRFIMDIDGKNMRLLMRGGDMDFESRMLNGHNEILKSGYDGISFVDDTGNERLIYPNAYVRRVEWSPDGEYIVLSDSATIVSRDGKKVMRVTNGIRADWYCPNDICSTSADAQ